MYTLSSSLTQCGLVGCTGSLDNETQKNGCRTAEILNLTHSQIAFAGILDVAVWYRIAVHVCTCMQVRNTHVHMYVYLAVVKPDYMYMVCACASLQRSYS